MPDKNKDGIPDYAQDGKGANDLGKAKGADSEDKDEKSDKKSDKDTSKVPPQLRKHVAKKMDEQEELEEAGAAMSHTNLDKDQGRERMLPDRIREEEEIEETTITEEEEEVEEGNNHELTRRLTGKKGEGPKAPDLGKGPATIATNRLKKEYEDKFANIEATSKLHETKQDRLNKRLMEWCTK